MGDIAILNVGAGDNKLVFDPSDAAGMIRAARIVKDMLRRGYALLVETGKGDDGKPVYQRATDFDEKTCEYIIADFDPVAAEKADEEEARRDEQSGQTTGEESAGATAGATGEPERLSPAPRAMGARRGPKPGSRRLAAVGTNSVAVARTAGG